ncbi:unnamed protein product [Closterium sp. NIES-53]
MVDRVPTLRRGATPALQKGDLPTQQVDGVPTLQQSGCPALPRRRQQVCADDWPDLHHCASVGCCLRLTSHIDFGIPTRSRLRHRDLDDVRVPPLNSLSRLPGRPGQLQVLWLTTKCLWSTTGSLWSTTAPVELPPGRRTPFVDHNCQLLSPSSPRRPLLTCQVDGLLRRLSGRTAPPGRRPTRRPDQSVATVELPGRQQHHNGPLQLDKACRAALPLSRRVSQAGNVSLLGADGGNGHERRRQRTAGKDRQQEPLVGGRWDLQVGGPQGARERAQQPPVGTGQQQLRSGGQQELQSGGQQQLRSGGQQMLQSGGQQQLQSGGQPELQSGGQQQLWSGMRQLLQSGGQQAWEAGGKQKLKAGAQQGLHRRRGGGRGSLGGGPVHGGCADVTEGG